MQATESARKIQLLKGKLMMRGHSLESWAKANGYKPVTVRAVVARHWGRPVSNVQGIRTEEILKKLRLEIAMETENENRQSV